MENYIFLNMNDEKIKPFRVMKPKRINELPTDFEGKIFQEKIDGGSVVIDVKLPRVDVIHARNVSSKIIWNNANYRYPDLVNEIRQGTVLKDNCTYIGELTVLDKDGIGRLWEFAKRSHLEGFQIQRMIRLKPVVFFVHHMVRDNDELLFDMPYRDILDMLKQNVKEGEHIRHIPTFTEPKPLLEQKGKIEGIVVKDIDGIYHKGKRGGGWDKLKFLKEKLIKFISYEKQEIGIKLYTDDNKPIHLAGHRVEIAIKEIENKGFIMAEIEFYKETEQGFRDASIKRIGNLKEAEI